MPRHDRKRGRQQSTSPSASSDDGSSRSKKKGDARRRRKQRYTRRDDDYHSNIFETLCDIEGHALRRDLAALRSQHTHVTRSITKARRLSLSDCSEGDGRSSNSSDSIFEGTDTTASDEDTDEYQEETSAALSGTDHESLTASAAAAALKSNRLVRLNIGGDRFEVPASTLVRYDSHHVEHPHQVTIPTSSSSSHSFFYHLVLADAAERQQSRRRRKDYSQQPDNDISSFPQTQTWHTLDRDDDGYILVDRDPRMFQKYILNYLRGYSRRVPILGGTGTHAAVQSEELALLRGDLDFFNIPGLRAFFGLPETADARSRHHTSGHHDDSGGSKSNEITCDSIVFGPQGGPGISVDQTRLRVSYNIATIGHKLLVYGRHAAHFEILANEYVGVGVVSENFIAPDAEFHRTPNCVVYYMTGILYTNCPHHRKEEGHTKFETGDVVSIVLDMLPPPMALPPATSSSAALTVAHAKDKDDEHGHAISGQPSAPAAPSFTPGRCRTVEFFINGSSKKVIPVPHAAGLRFAVSMKNQSAVRIVDDDELPKVLANRLQNMSEGSSDSVPAA